MIPLSYLSGAVEIQRLSGFIVELCKYLIAQEVMSRLDRPVSFLY